MDKRLIETLSQLFVNHGCTGVTIDVANNRIDFSFPDDHIKLDGPSTGDFSTPGSIRDFFEEDLSSISTDDSIYQKFRQDRDDSDAGSDLPSLVDEALDNEASPSKDKDKDKAKTSPKDKPSPSTTATTEGDNDEDDDDASLMKKIEKIISSDNKKERKAKKHRKNKKT